VRLRLRRPRSGLRFGVSRLCTVCYNGCSNESCPGTIDEADNTICTGVPYAWTCQDRFFNDGNLCHCGCGFPDPDCDSQELDACDRCNFEGSCSAQDCPGTIDPDNNAYCEQPDPPEGWTCGYYRYADGRQCDCGCGCDGPRLPQQLDRRV
jgi:hypothetical protein